MNVLPSVSGRRSTATTTTPSKFQEAEQRLNFYTQPPMMELSIDDFEVFALKRLKVLKKIEQLKMMRATPEKYNEHLNNVLVEQGLNNDQVDESSHFILRLCYCQSEELRRWFLQHEAHLFQYRLKSMDAKTMARAVRAHCQVQPIAANVKEQHRVALLQFMVNPAEYERSKFYAVPFTQVLDLVAARQCYLWRGQAFIPQGKVESLLGSKFRADLSKHLANMGAHHVLSKDTALQDPEAGRLVPLVANLNRCMVSEEPGAADVALQGSALNAVNVTQHVPYMPLCMRQLQSGLQKDKKLKHWGRLQYGLFLKGAGLSMEDALAFFQRQFSNLTGEQFTKEYAYNIRHMYGREGKRATYTSYSCSRIVLGNAPSSGEHHGCPYKHYDSQHLGQLLQKLSIGNSPADRSEILNLAKSGQPQLACVKHFQVMHPEAASRSHVPMDNVGNHPNAWFRASVAYNKNNQEQVKSEGLVTPEK